MVAAEPLRDVQILQWFGSFVSQILSTRERRALLVLLALVCAGYLIVAFRRPVEAPLPANLDSLRVAFQLQAALVCDSEWVSGNAENRGPVDVNSADLAALCRIPGIGPAKAQAILDLRATLGSFTSVEDLQRVRGIGPATLERIRNMIVAGPPPGADTLMAHRKQATE